MDGDERAGREYGRPEMRIGPHRSYSREIMDGNKRAHRGYGGPEVRSGRRRSYSREIMDEDERAYREYGGPEVRNGRRRSYSRETRRGFDDRLPSRSPGRGYDYRLPPRSPGRGYPYPPPLHSPEAAGAGPGPVDHEGKRVTVAVDITLANSGLRPSIKKPISRRPTAKRLEDRYGCESIQTFTVLNACRYIDDEGDESAELRYQRDPVVDAKSHFRWIHLQWKARSLSEFERFAYDISGIEMDDRMLIAELMGILRKDHEQISASRRILDPVVLRCDGRSSGRLQKEDKWIVFMCFPYLSLDPLSIQSPINTQRYHYTRSVLQSRYPAEYAQERDNEQVVRQFGQTGHDGVLHVPSLWIMIMSSGIILSSSPDELEDTVGPSIKISPVQQKSMEKNQSDDNGTVIRMTDPRRRVYFFPLKECGSWFALMDRILDVCREEFGHLPEQYAVTRPDGTEIKAQDWQPLCLAEKSNIINIVVRLLTPHAPEVLLKPLLEDSRRTKDYAGRIRLTGHYEDDADSPSHDSDSEDNSFKPDDAHDHKIDHSSALEAIYGAQQAECEDATQEEAMKQEMAGSPSEDAIHDDASLAGPSELEHSEHITPLVRRLDTDILLTVLGFEYSEDSKSLARHRDTTDILLVPLPQFEDALIRAEALASTFYTYWLLRSTRFVLNPPANWESHQKERRYLSEALTQCLLMMDDMEPTDSVDQEIRDAKLVIEKLRASSDEAQETGDIQTMSDLQYWIIPERTQQLEALEARRTQRAAEVAEVSIGQLRQDVNAVLQGLQSLATLPPAAMPNHKPAQTHEEAAATTLYWQNDRMKEKKTEQKQTEEHHSIGSAKYGRDDGAGVPGRSQTLVHQSSRRYPPVSREEYHARPAHASNHHRGAMVPRSRPRQYSPRQGLLPPNREARYLAALPSPTVINITNVPRSVFPKDFYNDLYFLQEAGRPMKSGDSIPKAKSRLEDLVAKKRDDAQPRSEKEQSDPKETASANNKKREVKIPAVFTWCLTPPSINLAPHPDTELEPLDRHDAADDDSTPGVPRNPYAATVEDEPEEKEQNLDREDRPGVEVVLESIHKALSRSRDYNMSLVSERKYTQGKIYRAIQAKSPKEFKSRMHNLAKVSRLDDSAADQNKSSTWQKRLLEVASNLRDLFEFFLPPDTLDDVSRKYWGAAVRLLQIIPNMCDPYYSRSLRVQSLDDEKVLGRAFYILDLSKVADSRSVAPAIIPSEPIEECRSCYNYHPHPTRVKARIHLRQIHFGGGAVSDSDLDPYILTHEMAWEYQQSADAQRLLSRISDHFTELCKSKEEIKHGVVGSRGFDESVYRLPASLVKAFERTLMLIAYVGHTCEMVHKAHKSQGEDGTPRTLIDSSFVQKITNLGYGAEGSFDMAKNDLMLMSHAGDYSRTISYEAVGPEYIVSLLLGDMVAKTNAADQLDLATMYRGYTSHLQYQANHRPRRRLIGKMALLREEVLAVDGVIQEQSKLVDTYQKLLNPESFQVTSITRLNMSRLERRLLQKISSKSAAQREQYVALAKEVDTLAEQAKQLIETEQDDHGKAILVFTIVTIIFQPLAFVTGLLGMNTAGIRTLSAGQWLFWATALPLTAIVVALSILVGYRIDELREWWEILSSGRKTQPALAKDEADVEYLSEEQSYTTSYYSYDTHSDPGLIQRVFRGGVRGIVGRRRAVVYVQERKRRTAPSKLNRWLKWITCYSGGRPEWTGGDEEVSWSSGYTSSTIESADRGSTSTERL